MIKYDKIKIRKIFKKLFDEFNFDGIAKCYSALNWVWGGRGCCNVPNIDELKQCVRDLIKIILDEGKWCNDGTGGFEVGFEENVIGKDLIEYYPYIRFVYQVRDYT